MKLEDICGLPVPGIATRDCGLLLWIPPTLLPDGLYAMRRWGFSYKQMLTWIKHRFIGGH
jgi:N6-adenosine-specific RNA methylase IME4